MPNRAAVWHVCGTTMVPGPVLVVVLFGHLGCDLGFWVGAGEGNRTLMTSLEGWGSAIELRPHVRWELCLGTGEHGQRTGSGHRRRTVAADRGGRGTRGGWSIGPGWIALEGAAGFRLSRRPVAPARPCGALDPGPWTVGYGSVPRDVAQLG
jgi:hypothetical protein